MDCYYSRGIGDFLLPKDEDLLDMHRSPENWSRWGTSPTDDVEFGFIDQSFSEKIELEPSMHDKDRPSSSRICEGLPECQQSFGPTACDEPNYQYRYSEPIDEIFLDSFLEGLPDVEKLQKSSYFNPENHCSNTPGGSQKDIAASQFAPCDSESNDWLDIEAPTAKELEAFEQCSRDGSVHEPLTPEESILLDFQIIIAQFDETSRICFRDALYRLSHDTEHVSVDTERYHDEEPIESKTNVVDRAVANLIFHKMDMNLQVLPLATASSNRQEEIGSKGLKGNGGS